MSDERKHQHFESALAIIRAEIPACTGGHIGPSDQSEKCTLWFEPDASKSDIARAYEIANVELTDAKFLVWEKAQAKAEADAISAKRIQEDELAAKVAVDTKRNAAHAAIENATTREEIEAAKKLAMQTEEVR